MPRIAVIIPFYRGEADLEAALRSIAASDVPARRIYIIDNSPAPADLSGPAARYPQMEIVRTRPAIGFGRACNAGLYRALAAGDDIGVVFNQDAVMAPGCLRHLTAPFALDPAIFAAVPVSMTYDLRDIYPQTLTNYVLAVPGLAEDWPRQQFRQPFYPVGPEQANGACVAISLRLLPRVGGFDPLFWMYGEDVEIFRRAIAGHGLRVVVAPQARIGHRHSNFSTTGPAADRIESLTRYGRMIGQMKNPARPFPLAVAEALARNLRPCLRALRAGKWDLLRTFLQNDLRLLGLLPLIARSRQPGFLHRRIAQALAEDQPAE